MKLNEQGVIIPKVLIATPTSARHGHLLDEWLAMLEALTYPNIEVCLVDTTPDTDSYYKLLKTKKVKGKPINVIRYEWNYEEFYAVQWLAYAREKIREFFLADKSYEHLFWLDDDIFLPVWGVQRLLSYNKEQVGFYAHVFFEEKERVPCILKSGEIVMGKGIQYFSFAEIDAYKDFVKRMGEDKLTETEKNLIPFIVQDPHHPQLFKPYATNLGCLLVKRNVAEAVPFITHPNFIMGEDLWYFNHANEKKFEFWCDSSYRCVHKNTEWNSVVKKGPEGGGFWLAMGPNDADKVEIIDRRLLPEAKENSQCPQ
jgi:hypothetical protein